MWMKRSICGIGVVSVAIRVESFERGIELSSEREKLGKSYWDFFLMVGFVIDLLLLPNLRFIQIFSYYLDMCIFFNRFFLLFICWISWVTSREPPEGGGGGGGGKAPFSP